MSYDNYFTTPELVKLLGISKQGIHYRRLTGKIKAKRFGRDWIYPKNQFKDSHD
jgi:hypothetical protein